MTDLRTLDRLIGSELTRLVIEFENELFSLSKYVDELKAGRSKLHGTFNMAAKVANLSAIAGKIEAMEAVKRTVNE